METLKREGILLDKNLKCKFGKYSGVNLKKLPKAYIYWVIDNIKLSDFDLVKLRYLNISSEYENKIEKRWKELI